VTALLDQLTQYCHMGYALRRFSANHRFRDFRLQRRQVLKLPQVHQVILLSID
jgi:hypothetical protein